MSSMSEPNDLRSSVSSFLRSSSETFLMLTSSDSAHRWSSSENAAWAPVWMYSARASSELCSSATRSFSSARRRSSSACISFSSSGRSRQRASWSTQVTIDAAKYRIFSSSLGAMSSR